MSRWIRTSCNVIGETLNCSSNASENDTNYITKDILEISRSVKGLGVIGNVNSELVNGERLRNERSCSHLFKDGQESDDKRVIIHEIGRELECGKAIDLKSDLQFPPVLHGIPDANDNTSIRGCRFLDAVTSKNNQLPHANLRTLKGNANGCNTLSQAVDLVSDRKKDCQSQSNITSNECFRESNTPLLFYTPSMSDHQLPTFDQKLRHRPSPSPYIASEKTGTEKSCFDCYSLHKLRHRIHDAETMKICTTMDSVEGGFSQTSKVLLIIMNYDASLPKECDILATTRVITKINRNIPSAVHGLLPFSSQGKQGVIPEALTCSADSEGRGNAVDIKTSKVTINKVSSAETDTVDMNLSKERNLHLGGHSTSSDKAFHMEANSDSSSSKIPVLELEIPMECDDQTTQKSNLCMDNSPDSESGYRWVKILKLSSSHSSARGTKCVNLAENSGRKRNNFSSRLLNSDITISGSTPMMHHAEESMASDKSINLSKENFGNDFSLSHVWMQRWLLDGSKSTRKNPYTMVDCEPQSLEWALEDLRKDRSPSIRTMALMGKGHEKFSTM